MAWNAESKRHSIAKKYGSAGSKKTKTSSMSSHSAKFKLKSLVTNTISETEKLTQQIFALNDKRIQLIEEAEAALKTSEKDKDIDSEFFDSKMTKLFDADVSQEDDIREFVLNEERQHDTDEEDEETEEDEGYESENDEE